MGVNGVSDFSRAPCVGTQEMLSSRNKMRWLLYSCKKLWTWQSSSGVLWILSPSTLARQPCEQILYSSLNLHCHIPRSLYYSPRPEEKFKRGNPDSAMEALPQGENALFCRHPHTHLTPFTLSIQVYMWKEYVVSSISFLGHVHVNYALLPAADADKQRARQWGDFPLRLVTWPKLSIGCCLSLLHSSLLGSKSKWTPN